MGTFVGNLSDLLALVVQRLRLSALVPSALLVTINAVCVWPLLRRTSLLSGTSLEMAEGTAIFLGALATLALGYALVALNVPIIRLFEGYPFHWAAGRHRDRRRALADALRELQRKSHEAERSLKKSAGSPGLHREWEARQAIAQMRLSSVVRELMDYPEDAWRILPTGLGNVIAAAEGFPYDAFGMDAVVLWPYLLPVLVQQGYAVLVEKEKAVMDFLLNTALVLVVLGLELAAALFLLVRPLARYFLVAGFVGATLALFALLAYRFAVYGARGWAATIRVAFTLHRDSLRKKLHMADPGSFGEEAWAWELVSKFLRGERECLVEDSEDPAEEVCLLDEIFTYGQSPQPTELGARPYQEEVGV